MFLCAFDKKKFTSTQRRHFFTNSHSDAISRSQLESLVVFSTLSCCVQYTFCLVHFKMFKIVKFHDLSVEKLIHMVPSEWEENDMCYLPVNNIFGAEIKHDTKIPCTVLRRDIESIGTGKMILEAMQSELDAAMVK